MVTPATGNLERSDLLQLYNVVQCTLMAYPKEIIIGLLRDEFSKDSFYRHVSDQYGFSKVVDLTNESLDAGYHNDDSTRIYIGQAFHFDGVFYPCLLVKQTSAKSVPISMSRNRDVVVWEKQLVVDGYGNTKEYFTPKFLEFAGAFDGTITIDVLARDILARDNLINILMLMFADIRFETLRKAGILVKSGQPSMGGVSEGDDRNKNKIYKATVSIDIRTEWRRLIPVDGVVEQVNLCVDFGLTTETSMPNPNMQINSTMSLLDLIDNLPVSKNIYPEIPVVERFSNPEPGTENE